MSRCEHTDVCWWIRRLHAEIFALVSDLKKKMTKEFYIEEKCLDCRYIVFNSWNNVAICFFPFRTLFCFEHIGNYLGQV